LYQKNGVTYGYDNNGLVIGANIEEICEDGVTKFKINHNLKHYTRFVSQTFDLQRFNMICDDVVNNLVAKIAGNNWKEITYNLTMDLLNNERKMGYFVSNPLLNFLENIKEPKGRIVYGGCK
jgi:hypothetical protein